MKTTFKISFLLMLILAIISCEKTVKKEKQLVHKSYGKMIDQNDSLGVELKLSQFNNWRYVLKQSEIISCNDSLPKITLKTENEIKTVYFVNACMKNFGCILIKERNTIQIHNDIINKYGDYYPLDSLENVLRRDIENNGKRSDLSDSPEKLLIYISYDNNRIQSFKTTLSQLIQTYERVTNNTNINIWLNEKVNYPIPPPPPPKELEEIELIEDEI